MILPVDEGPLSLVMSIKAFGWNWIRVARWPRSGKGWVQLYAERVVVVVVVKRESQLMRDGGKD